MSTRTTIVAAVLMGALAVPAGAQQHQHGQMEGQEPSTMMSCPMMQQMMQGMHGQMMMEGMEMGEMQGQMMGPGMMGMRGSPGMILRSSEALALTPSQTERLEALQEQVQSEHKEHMRATMAAHQQAAAALGGDAADLDTYTAALNEAADHMVMAHVAMARATLEAREILTPEQRDKLGSVTGGMHGKMMPRGMGHDGHR